MQEKRLSKVLAAAGVASRRKCETLIFEGKVKVNNKIILLPQTLVDLEKDRIVVDGQRILQEEKKIYYLLNKPLAYVCSNNREKHKKVVIDLFPDDTRLFTIGRLDKDTTGLIIVTNDGHFANQVIHPSAKIQKEYLLKVPQEVHESHLVQLAKGCFVEGTFVKPYQVKKLRRGTLKIIVMEGKKREVRILAEKAGLRIKSLSRVRIGNLFLGNLQVGQFRLLQENEKQAIFQ